MLEQFAKAGECYEQPSDFAQAAEMFASAGDCARAAARTSRRAGHFADAAECCAQTRASREREAELLARAGMTLQRGRDPPRATALEDEAIKALQQVAPEHADFAAASALLGEIFRRTGKHSLAIKKLRQAIGDAELDARQRAGLHYTLATVYEANEQSAGGGRALREDPRLRLPLRATSSARLEAAREPRS